MKPRSDEIEINHRRQATFWNSVAEGWKDDREFVECWLEPISRRIAEHLGQGNGLLLDIGCGASTQPLPTAWTRIGIDLAEEMLTAGNFVAAAESIPFKSATFAGCNSRFCLMFCPDVPFAFREVSRVLVPGGRFVFAVWGKPEENLWSKLANEKFARRAGIRTPDPSEPGAFRLSNREEVQGLLNTAGFLDIEVNQVKLPMFQSIGPKRAIDALLRLAGPMKMAFQRIPDGEKADAINEVLEALSKSDATGSADVWSCKNKY